MSNPEHGQAPADFYLGAAIESIDRRLGPGFSREHPELIGALVLAAALDGLAAAIDHEAGP